MRLPHVFLSTIRNRVLRVACSRPADFLVGRPEDVYLQRWYVIPRNSFFNIYLHHFLRSDDDRALHDHPYLLNVSIMLDGCYDEHTIRAGGVSVRTRRVIGDVVLRGPLWAHRVELVDGASCWTLFVTGPRVRTWGFHCPKGWIPWQKFVDVSGAGHVGRGCGEE